MFSMILTEDIEQNKLYREQALQIWDEFISYVKSGGELRYQTPGGPIQIYGDGKIVKGGYEVRISEFSEEVEDDLLIKIGVSRDGSGGTYMRHGNDFGFYPRIILNSIPSERIRLHFGKVKEEYLSHKDEEFFDYETYEASDLPYWKDDINHKFYHKKIWDSLRGDLSSLLDGGSRRTFIHEYTHYIDLRYKDAVKSYIAPEIDEENFEKYFTDPIEINARVQTAMAEFQRARKEHPELIWNKPDLEGNPKEDFQSFYELFREDFLKSLNSVEKVETYYLDNEDIKKSIIKRLYKFWKKYVED